MEDLVENARKVSNNVAKKTDVHACMRPAKRGVVHRERSASTVPVARRRAKALRVVRMRVVCTVEPVKTQMNAV